MKVKDLIKELQKHDPEKLVCIQQGEEFDYMLVQSVTKVELYDERNIDEDATYEAVAIMYN